MAAVPYPPPSPSSGSPAFSVATLGILALVGVVAWKFIETRQEEREGEERLAELDELARRYEEGGFIE